jgi:hypothetical protein
MQDGSSAPLAVLLHFQFLGLLLFVHRRRVIPPFTSRAYQTNDIGHEPFQLPFYNYFF